MTTVTTPQRATPPPQRLLTIGAVCRRLKPEFPDISISKIRYLEDQGLLQPKRTQGGYRLFGEQDVERLGGEVVGVLFLIELDFLHGRERLGAYDVHSLITY